MKKWMDTHFSNEDIQMAIKHMKTCSTSLIIREMQTKTTKRRHLTWLEWLSSKTLQTTNAGGGGGKRTLLHCWWECKLMEIP